MNILLTSILVSPAVGAAEQANVAKVTEKCEAPTILSYGATFSKDYDVSAKEACGLTSKEKMGLVSYKMTRAIHEISQTALSLAWGDISKKGLLLNKKMYKKTTGVEENIDHLIADAATMNYARLQWFGKQNGLATLNKKAIKMLSAISNVYQLEKTSFVDKVKGHLGVTVIAWLKLGDKILAFLGYFVVKRMAEVTLAKTTKVTDDSNFRVSIGANQIVSHLFEAIQETVKDIFPAAPSQPFILLSLAGKIVDNGLQLTPCPSPAGAQCSELWQLLVAEDQRLSDETANFALQLVRSAQKFIGPESMISKLLLKAARVFQASVPIARLIVYVSMSESEAISSGEEFEYERCTV